METKKAASVLRNNLHMLGEVWRACPSRVLCAILQRVLRKFATAFLIQIFLFKYVIDSVEQGRSFASVVGVITPTMILVVACLLFVEWYNNLCVPNTDAKINEYFCTKLYKKAQEVDLSCYDDPAFYNSFARAITDSVNQAREVLDSATEMIAQISALVGLMSIFLLLDPFLIVISLIPVVVTFPLNKVKNDFSYRKYNELVPVNRKLAYINNVFYQKQYAKEIRLTKVSEILFTRLREGYADLVMANKKYGWRGFLIGSWEIVNQMGIVAYGGYLYLLYQIIVLKNLTIGDFTAMFNAVRVVDVELRLTASQINKIHNHSLYIDSYRTFIEYKNEVRNDSETRLIDHSHNDIRIENLSFGYDASNCILKNVSMEIKHGEKVAIVGHNGAGKTTIVKLLLRLYDPQEGRILHNGNDIKGYDIAQYRDMFGTVFQDFSLFAFTLGENVVMRRYYNDDENRVKEALQKGGFTVDMSVDTFVTKEFDDKGYIPSGGLAQKIAIGRAFAKDSDILILDEPSSALDPMAEYEFNKQLLELSKDKTVVFISHRLSTTVAADRIYYLENGEVIEEGNHDDLMGRNGRYAHMFRLQAENYRDARRLEA